MSIAAWSEAELRNFIVNTILTDPGAMPPGPMPKEPNAGSVPVWDPNTNAWVSSNNRMASGAGTYTPRSPSVVPDLPFQSWVRTQATVNWTSADTNYREYNIYTQGGEIIRQDPYGYFSYGAQGLRLQRGNYCIFHTYLHGALNTTVTAHFGLKYTFEDGTVANDYMPGHSIGSGASASDVAGHNATGVGFTPNGQHKWTEIMFTGWNSAGGSGTSVLTVIRV